MGERILHVIENVAVWIDAAGVVVIVVGIVWGLAGWMRERLKPGADGCEVYMNCRQRIGRSIVLGLEILVASDIIHTVAIEPTMMNAGVLAVLLVRDESGRANYFVLVDEAGGAVNERVLDYVALPVEITGKVVQLGDRLVLKAPLSAYRLLE